MAVGIRPQTGVATASPQKLFSGPFARGTWITSYDVAADGQRFLMVKRPGDGEPSTVTVVLNWATTLGNAVTRQ